ncbi:MAG: hypothetical protein IPH16_09230 [Haliscomenobacter sp.]|nr:hypothetical protein [Haliscomenobacter sp.]
MVKISAITAQLIHQSPFIAEALEEGLINVAALARKLQPEVSKIAGKPVQAGAIVMAIQRMQPGNLHQPGQSLRSFFRKVQDISVRSGVLDYTFQNSGTLAECQARLLAQIGQKPTVYYSVSRGIAETTLLVSQAVEREVDELLQRKKARQAKRPECHQPDAARREPGLIWDLLLYPPAVGLEWNQRGRGRVYIE